MNLRIGILGTRGIPNHYGGFEQFAEYLSTGLAARGHEVFVYNSHNHPYQQSQWRNVQLIHCFDPEFRLGSFGQFIYDFNCILDVRKRKFDVILMLGFTSSSAWGWLYPNDSTLIFNMDGLEWKRTKYSKPVQQFLRLAERLAVRCSHYHIADSEVIQSYLQSKYAIESEHISYGAEIYYNEEERLLQEYGVTKNNYFLLMARMAAENNIEMILDGFHASSTDKKFLVVGSVDNKLGRYLVHKYKGDVRIVFTGGIYNHPQKIHSLKTFSSLYFHGHSVGGTNPSLLEAMASRALVAAHDNAFNRSVLQQDAFYFSSAKQVTDIIQHPVRNEQTFAMINNNLQKIKSQFSWENIINKYETFLQQCVIKRMASWQPQETPTHHSPRPNVPFGTGGH
jgi:glycosyltransferase involved in cell wall biosynthesis